MTNIAKNPYVRAIIAAILFFLVGGTALGLLLGNVRLETGSGAERPEYRIDDRI